MGYYLHYHYITRSLWKIKALISTHIYELQWFETTPCNSISISTNQNEQLGFFLNQTRLK